MERALSILLLFTDEAPAWRVTGATPAWPDIRTIVGKMVADVGAGKRSPKDGLDDAAKQAQVLLDQYFASRTGR